MICSRLTRSPHPTLNASPEAAGARAANTLASTTLSMYVKSRDCSPVPCTSIGSPRNAQRMKRGMTAAYSEAGSCRGPNTLK